MKPILAVVHVYYPEMWDELKSYLSNITLPYDLHVTIVEKNKYLQDDIIKFKKDAHVEVVENRGYDVGPFIQIINKINLNDYEYVIKLHTKRDWPIGTMMQGYDMSGGKWRKYALSFLEKDNFKKCLQAFEQNKRLGMVSNFHLIMNKERYDFDAMKKAKKMLKIEDLNGYERFVGGTMFMCRANCLKLLQRLNLKIGDFTKPDEKHSSSLAHVIERYIGISVCAQEYAIEDIYTDATYRLFCEKTAIFHRIFRFIYRKTN